MARFGYKLMSEEHDPNVLVENARRAEQAGFDFVAISDHYHPWILLAKSHRVMLRRHLPSAGRTG
jgi:alkanesulfonate monooxygenase SsuD/methylene tetrahydromethanopterin reductase-like flavin-dependent oxidoreductase (luciferase family)